MIRGIRVVNEDIKITLGLFIFALINLAKLCENGNIVIYITS